MVTRGTWRPVNDRREWTGRRDVGRALLKTAKNACDVAEESDDCRLVMQGAILAAIAYGDALTIKVAGIRNQADHQRLPATVRQALGNAVPAAELTRLTRLLARKDDSAYGHRFIAMSEAREALEKAEAFAAWAEGELARA
jgi:hypothetical protein